VSDLEEFIVEGLSLTTPAGKCLLENSSFTLGGSQVTLLVGPSGSGKSSVIKLLSGLLALDGGAWAARGRLRHGDKIYDLARDRCDIGGLVFQNYALFDDLSVLANLNIALDHAHQRDPTLIEHVVGLLNDIDPHQSTAASSGGQRQRIAIARTLLANRPLLMFDEPNSGLDPYSAQRLGELIRDLCRRMGRPVLIVAHHVDSLLPLVDVVYLLDTRTRTLRRLPVDHAAVESALLELGGGEDEPLAGVAGAGQRPAAEDWRGQLLAHAPRHWFLRYLHEYFWILWASPLMLLYIFSGAAIVGFVTLWFGFNYELLGDLIRSFVHDESLAGIGFVQSNIAVPLIGCILMVARNNAIITADLGNRVLSAQFLAMRNLRIPGRAYLTAAILLNTLLGGLVLVAASLAMAGWAAFHAWQLIFPDLPFELWQENFFRHLLVNPGAWARNLGWVILKVLLSTGCGAWLAIQAGLSRKDSVISVHYAIARSIVLGVSATLIIHASITVAVY